MEKKEDTNKEIQEALTKLISDEWFAGQIYRQLVFQMDADTRASIGELFMDIASDELNDHFKSLVDFALNAGYKVPASYNELKKKADKEDVKVFESHSMKDEDVFYYLKKMAESEQRAIETYEKYIDADEIRKTPVLQMIIQNNYYDEIDHLKKLHFAFNSLEAMKIYT